MGKIEDIYVLHKIPEGLVKKANELVKMGYYPDLNTLMTDSLMAIINHVKEIEELSMYRSIFKGNSKNRRERHI